MLDIIYSEINRLRDAKQNKEEQLNIAKQLVKKALLKYYLDWDSYRKSVQYDFSNADDILLDYANMLIDVSVEVFDLLPRRLIDEVTGIATQIRSAVDDMNIASIEDTQVEMFSKPDKCALDAFEIYNKFDEYLKEPKYNY